MEGNPWASFFSYCCSTASVASCPGNEFRRQIFYDSWWGHPLSWFDGLAMIFRSPMESAACRWPYGMQCVVAGFLKSGLKLMSQNVMCELVTLLIGRKSSEFTTSASHLACIPLLVSCPLLAVYKWFNRSHTILQSPASLLALLANQLLLSSTSPSMSIYVS